MLKDKLAKAKKKQHKDEWANKTATSETVSVTQQISSSPSQTTYLQIQTDTTNAQYNIQLNEVISIRIEFNHP